ncbi:MAG: hypothetical protein WCA20_23090 [Candidatus Sulfotelmatobacter sp.]
MKTTYRSLALALFLVLVLLVPVSLFAQSPFDGTWHTNMDQSKISPKPIVVSLKNAMYDCSSCNPQIHVKADGQDQSVTGQSYDTISVREIDSKAIEVKTKKNGKPVSEQTRTVSDDGKTFTLKSTSYRPGNDQTVTAEVTYTRIGKAPAGANGTSGSWRVNKVNVSENGVTTTYKSDGDDLTMSTPAGEGYTAKLDGKDYPYKGTFSYDAVSLKRINDRTIEETDKLNGKVMQVSKMTVSSDGKTITVVSTYVPTNRTSTYVDTKQ